MAGEKANKVKFNIKNVHYALLNEGADGEVTWETPKKIPGAVSIALMQAEKSLRSMRTGLYITRAAQTRDMRAIWRWRLSQTTSV